MLTNFVMPEGNSLVNLSSDIFGHFSLKTTSDGLNINYKHKKLCFILLDGLGWNVYKKTGVSFGDAIKATSVFPSTTSNALSSLFLNRYPGEHGIIGYQLYIKQLGAIVNILGYTSSAAYMRDSMERAYPLASIFNYESKITSLYHAGYSTVNIIPTFINHTSFSNLLYGNNETDVYSNIFHSFSVFEENLKKNYDFISYYVPDIDQISHKLGPGNEHTIEAARYILTQIYSIIKKYDDYDFIITADHGHIEVGDTINLGNDSGLSDLSVLPAYGDSRALFLDYNAELEGYINKNYENILTVKKADSLYEKLLGRVNDNVKKNLPGMIGISKNNDIYHFPFNQRKYTMLGAHSGLLADEMEIPIIKL
ncbi:MAG: alkaline phosphatase family protein [Ferroplasma sp.]